MLRRRDFLGGAFGLTASTLIGKAAAAPLRTPKPYFGLHPFIEANPKAVFIRRTRVPNKLDAQAKLQTGLQLARDIFVPLDRPGVPVGHRIVLKPNFTSVPDHEKPESKWGTGTDSAFYEGMLVGMKELGLSRFHFIEANSFPLWNYRGFVDINERQGVRMNEPDRRDRQFREGDGITWSEVPDGVVFKRIPHYAPVNEPDTWLLNIAKWKAHSMCLTQSVKNEQGLVVPPYVRFCMGFNTVTGVSDSMKPNFQSTAETKLKALFESHRKMGYSRYDSAAVLSPMHQEIWAHKTCDNQSVLRTGLSIIEGIYARDGDGFGVGTDYMTNLVMFSKDNFRLDLVGLYLGGHEPGNVNLYRIAKERGLSDTFNPWDVPIYEFEEGKPAPRKLSDYERISLKCPYLVKDGEPAYHLVNERFDYDRIKV